jgi:hypothetical protein
MRVDAKLAWFGLPFGEANEDRDIQQRCLRSSAFYGELPEDNGLRSTARRKFAHTAISAPVWQLVLVLIALWNPCTALDGATRSQLLMQAAPIESSQETVKQRYMVLYKVGVTDKDRERVRGKLHAVVLNRFSNPLREELEVQIANTDKGRAELAKRLECVKRDPAVQSIQPSYSYSIM